MGETGRGSFTGRIGFIIASASSCVGLGNLWRFPYLVEQFGGGMFILIFLVATFTFGLIMMLTEVIIGKKTGKTSIEAYRTLCSKYRWIGWFGLLVPVIILCYYCVIGGWVMRYVFAYVAGDISAFTNITSSTNFFESFVNCSATNIFEGPVFWFIVFAVISVAIVIFAVNKGMERLSKFCLPALLVLLIILVASIFTIPGIGAGIEKYFVPNFSDLSGSTVLNAIGQVFFSMSLGQGIMIAFGSYMASDVKPYDAVKKTTVINFLTALLCGLLVVPVVFVYSDPSMGSVGGPGLMFEVIPTVISHLDIPQIAGILFFVMVFFAAWTSAVSMAEAFVSVLKDTLKFKRKLSASILLAIIMVFGMLVCLGYGPLSSISIGGMCLLDFFDFLANSIMLPLCAIMTCLVVGYAIKPEVIIGEVEKGGETINVKYYSLMVKYICPVLLVLILIGSLTGIV